jgi:hypothetical protein
MHGTSRSTAAGLAAASLSLSLSLVLALASAPARAQDGGLALRHGPLAPGVPRVFDLRTGRPHALVLVYRSWAAGPYVPADPLLPALGVAPGSVPLARVADAAGRIRVVAPPASASLAPARVTFQALVRAPDGRWDATEPVSVRRSPPPPAGAWLAESASSPLPPAALDLGAHAVLAVDLDRDGDRELVLAHGAGVALWIDEGPAGFAPAPADRLPHPAVPISCLASADVDRDGDLDLFVGGLLDGSNVWPDRLWRNDGAARFSADPLFPPGDGSTSCAEFGDVDGDGDPDLLVARGADGHGGIVSPCQLLRNHSALFTPDLAFQSMPWNHGLVPCPAARFGDVDDDGDLDVFVARSDISGVHQGPGEPNVLLLNDGAGNFTDVSAQRFSATYSDNSLDVRFVDVDLDGDLDLVVANSVGGVAPAASGDLWINQGGSQGGAPGHFVDDATSPLESASPLHRVRLGILADDFDSDGDPDLLVLLHDLPPASQTMLLVNQGGAQPGLLGRFELATWFAPGGLISGGAVSFDRGHDGRREVALLSSGTLTGDPATARRVLWLETSLP